MHPTKANPEPVATGLGAQKSDHKLAGWIASENITPAPRDLQVRKLQRAYGLSYSIACTIARLAFAGLPR